MKQTKKIVSLLLAAVMMFSLMSVCAFAEPIGTSAVTLSDGLKNSSEKVGDRNLESYVDYKYVAKKDGILELNADVTLACFYIYLVNEDGEEIPLISSDVKCGSYQEVSGGALWVFWKSELEKFNATLNYRVEKGTYYIRIMRGADNKGDGTVKLTATLRDDPKPQLDCFNITLKKGEKLTLGTSVTPKNTKLVWESSKKTVATVSAKGVVTAKKAGTTIITCTTEDGSSELQIKITVSKK